MNDSRIREFTLPYTATAPCRIVSIGGVSLDPPIEVQPGETIDVSKVAASRGIVATIHNMEWLEG